MANCRQEKQDRLLIRAAQEGDTEARNELIHRYRPRLLRLIHGRLDARLHARLDSSDIAQEALYQADRDLSHYWPQSRVPFYAWLREITWRHVLRASERHISAQKRSVLKERPSIGNAVHPQCWQKLASLSTPSHTAMRDEMSEKLELALNALSAADREVLELRFFRQLNGKEVAAALRISQVASRQRLTRALDRLAKQLEARGRPP